MSRSPIVVRSPHLYTQGPFGDPISWQQKPRNEVHSQIFWFKMVVGFTGTANEVVPTATEPEGFDALVTGAWTDETRARVRDDLRRRGVSSRPLREARRLLTGGVRR